MADEHYCERCEDKAAALQARLSRLVKAGDALDESLSGECCDHCGAYGETPLDKLCASCQRTARILTAWRTESKGIERA